MTKLFALIFTVALFTACNDHQNQAMNTSSLDSTQMPVNDQAADIV